MFYSFMVIIPAYFLQPKYDIGIFLCNYDLPTLFQKQFVKVLG